MLERYRGFLLAGVFGIGSLGTAATHHPEIEIPSNFVISPAFQDFSVPIRINKTIYEDFTPIYTSTTLKLTQDFRARLAGTATFSSSRAADSRTFTLSGKLKFKKNVLTFSAKGSDSQSSISLTGTLTDFVYPQHASTVRHLPGGTAVQTTDPAELISQSTFLFGIQIKGTTKPYKFEQEAQTTGSDFIHYQLASAGDTIGLPDKKDSDYYQLIAPWGTALATGNTQLFAPAVIFTLKAPKFAAVLTDTDATAGFEPETYSIKTGAGKYVGMVNP